MFAKTREASPTTTAQLAEIAARQAEVIAGLDGLRQLVSSNHQHTWDSDRALHGTVLQRLAQVERRIAPPATVAGGAIGTVDLVRPRLLAAAGVVPDGVAEVETDVGTLAMPEDDEVMLPHFREHGEWEVEVRNALRSAAGAGGVAIDVGAHVGYFTLHLAEAVGPDGLVLAVEADPAIARILAFNVARRGAGNVVILGAAAMDESGTVPFSRSPFQNSGDGRAFSWDVSGEVLDVPAVRLDDVVPPELAVTVMKVDVQGADLKAIRGAEGILRRHRPAMVVEFTPAALRDFGDAPDDAVRMFARHGYRFAALEDADLSDGLAPDEFVERVEKRSTGYVDLLLRAGD